MCQFFSVVSDGKGKIMYSDWAARQEYLAGKRQGSPDSHTSIAFDHGYRGTAEDALNKYEYNPLTGKFEIDQINTKYDRHKVKAFCKQLDFRTIVPALRIKPIVNPFADIQQKRATVKDVTLLRQWASVWDSVRASVRDSVLASVGASVWDSVLASVGDSVWDSVRDSVRYSVGDSVGDSVRASVRDSVWASVWAYVGSFFDLPQWKYIKHKPGEYPFQPAVDLWERGIVPSFDGKTCRLHGYEGKVLKGIEAAKLGGEGN